MTISFTVTVQENESEDGEKLKRDNDKIAKIIIKEGFDEVAGSKCRV